MEVDEALEKVGGFRRWHLTIFWLVGISTFIPLCWQGLAIVFEGWVPPHHCKIPDGALLNESIPMKPDGVTRHNCLMYVNKSISNDTMECNNGWTFDINNDVTIVTEWKLVCKDDFFSELSQAIYQVGALVGELICAYFVDRFGRKKVHIASHVVICALGIGVAFTQSYIAFVVLRACVGFMVVACTYSGIIMIMELFDSKKRAFAGIGLEGQWVILYMLLTLLGYLIRNWRYLQLFISLCSVVWIAYYWFLPESVMWLVAKGRYEEAERILVKMAKSNGVPIKEIKLNRLAQYSEPLLEKNNIGSTENNSNDITSDKEKNSFGSKTLVSIQQPLTKMKDPSAVGIWDLFADPVLRIHTLIISLLWFANCLVYYAMILYTPALGGDRFINFFLGALVEIPAYALTLFIVNKYGRRVPTCVCHILAGIPLAAAIFIPQQANGVDLLALKTAVFMIGKFAITMSFAIIILYTRELFPTNVRGTSGGVCNILGRIGNILAPFASFAARNTPWLPNVILASISVIAGLACLILPDTLDQPLPQTLEDIYILNGKIKRDRTNSCLDTKS